MRHSLRCFLRALPHFPLLLILVACGGGGSGSSDSISSPPPVSIELFAGTAGGTGNIDARGTAATFGRLSGVAVDSSGTIYVADAGNLTVRRIAPDGLVSTLAGTPRQSGFIDGTGAAARFRRLDDIAVDGLGNVYVADSDRDSNAIRRVTPSGVVTTFAGSGAEGSQDGAARQATFRSPRGVAVDARGDVYVADSGNCTIRRIDSFGAVSTYAGIPNHCDNIDGPVTQAQLRVPEHIALDTAGNVFVSTGSAVRKITTDRNVTTFAGNLDRSGYIDAMGTAALFSAIGGLAVDAGGNVYVTDAGNKVIRKITAQGIVTTLAGQPGIEGLQDGPRAGATFTFPWGIAADPGGALVVTETSQSVVRRVTVTGDVSTIAGQPPAQSGHVDGPRAQARFGTLNDIVADAAGNIYVADPPWIRRIDASGTVETVAGDLPILLGVAVDASGTLFAVSFSLCGPPQHTCDSRLYRIGAGGQKTIVCELQRFLPSGLVIDPSGNFLINGFNEGTFKVAADCTQTQIAPPGPERRGIARDSPGNVYIADTGSHQVLKIAPSGEVATFAGKAGEPGDVDGAGSGARFNGPSDVAVDSEGNVYVADSGNMLVRKITPAGIVSTIAGAPGQDGFVSGPLPGVVSPRALTVIGSDLYIAMGTGVAVIHNRP